MLFIVMKTKKKSRAEIQRAYRERLLAKNAELVREKERKRWRNRRSLNKIKTIGNMTEREKRSVRRIWRTHKAEYRAKLKTSKADTPPPSLDSSLVSFQQRAKQGRARVAYRRTKAYRKIALLESTVDALKTSKERYKKRWMRLKVFG